MRHGTAVRMDEKHSLELAHGQPGFFQTDVRLVFQSFTDNLYQVADIIVHTPKPSFLKWNLQEPMQPVSASYWPIYVACYNLT